MKLNVFLMITMVGVHFQPNVIDALKNLPQSTSQMLDAKTLLVRKKRYIFFTPGSAVQATMSFSKSIVSLHPRGVNLLGEVDLFYPLQTNLADWFPTTKKPPVVVAAVVKAKPKVDQPNASAYSDSYPSVDRYYASQRPTNYWSHPQSLTKMYYTNPSRNDRPSSDTNYNRSTSALHPSTYDSYYYPRAPQYDPSNTLRRQSQWPAPNPNAASSAPRRNSNSNRRKSFPLSTERPIYYSEWKHHRGYRERRDIYTQFERMATDHGLDIRGCLLRLICETRHYLLPQGKSFFHDALRILFFVPVHHGDSYADAMHSTAADCATEYRKECRYSVLGLLLHPDKHSFG